MNGETVRRLLVCLLSSASLAAVADDASPIEDSASLTNSHWSGLPIWGEDARARGFDIPLPFGVGFNIYHEEQPFNVTDLAVSGTSGNRVSVSQFIEVGQIETKQNNYSARLDTWLFPFLNVYGIVGYTSGQMNGTVFVPQVSVGPIVIVPATTLPLNIAYDGLTYGGGVTLAGGTRISTWRDLTLFVVADGNYTRTPLNFRDEALDSDSIMTAWIASFRLGTRAKLSESVHASFWAGAMIQYVDQTLEGQVSPLGIGFAVTEESEAPVNALLGMRFELGTHWDFLVEGGIGTRTSIMGSLGFRF